MFTYGLIAVGLSRYVFSPWSTPALCACQKPFCGSSTGTQEILDARLGVVSAKGDLTCALLGQVKGEASIHTRQFEAAQEVEGLPNGP